MVVLMRRLLQTKERPRRSGHMALRITRDLKNAWNSNHFTKCFHVYIVVQAG